MLKRLELCPLKPTGAPRSQGLLAEVHVWVVEALARGRCGAHTGTCWQLGFLEMPPAQLFSGGLGTVPQKALLVLGSQTAVLGTAHVCRWGLSL